MTERQITRWIRSRLVTMPTQPSITQTAAA